MTNVERLAAQMEFDDGARRRLALELVKLRALEGECRRQQRRLPHQVQTALRVDAVEVELDPPPAGDPGLFSRRSNA